MARIIGGVDPANDHSFSSVWNLNSDIVNQSFKDGTWPDLPTTATVTAEVFGAGGGGGNSTTSGAGGDGGIVKASKSIGIGTVLKIVVGNGGRGYRNQDTGQLQGNTSDPMRGGYIYSDESNQTGAQGGSGSGVFVTSVTHSNAQVVAGGGGGGAGNNNADGGNGGGSASVSSSLAGANGTSPGSGYWRGLGASTTAGGASRDSGVSSGAGAALIGGFSGTASSTAGGPYSSGGSGAGGYYGGGGARHGSSAAEQGGGGGGSSYVEGTWTRLAATGMTPKAGAPAQNGNYAYQDGANGEVKITDGAGTTTYSTPGTYDHTVS